MAVACRIAAPSDRSQLTHVKWSPLASFAPDADARRRAAPYARAHEDHRLRSCWRPPRVLRPQPRRPRPRRRQRRHANRPGASSARFAATYGFRLGRRRRSPSPPTVTCSSRARRRAASSPTSSRATRRVRQGDQDPDAAAPRRRRGASLRRGARRRERIRQATRGSPASRLARRSPPAGAAFEPSLRGRSGRRPRHRARDRRGLPFDPHPSEAADRVAFVVDGDLWTIEARAGAARPPDHRPATTSRTQPPSSSRRRRWIAGAATGGTGWQPHRLPAERPVACRHACGRSRTSGGGADTVPLPAGGSPERGGKPGSYRRRAASPRGSSGITPAGHTSRASSGRIAGRSRWW